MRVSGWVSTGPNCAKSTAGAAGSAEAARRGGGCGSSAGECALDEALMSSWVMRPLKPWPATRARSTPSSRAKRRTEGPACAREKPGSSIGARSVRAPGSGSRRGRRRRAGRRRPVPAQRRPMARLRVQRRRCGSGAARRRWRRACRLRRGRRAHRSLTVATRSPAETLPPLAMWIFSTTPATGGRHVHGRLVRLEGDERGFHLNGLAGLDQHVDDRDVLEAAQVGHAHFRDCHLHATVRFRLSRGRAWRDRRPGP